MYQLIRLGNCVHVFDRDSHRFVKCTFTAVKTALGARNLPTTRKEILKTVQWVQCTDPGCRVQDCLKGGHWIAKL